MKKLLSDDLWEVIARLARKHRRIRAAIAYVTAQHFQLKTGDLLVCDASDQAIRGGLTNAKTLRAFRNAGAQLYSYAGLHSKVAVIDRVALIGSANMSMNAGIETCEASLLTDDPQVSALAQGFVEKVRREATLVDESFLKRVSRIPVVRTRKIRRTRGRRIVMGESRVWFMGTVPDNEESSEAEEAFEEAGREEARRRSGKRHLDPIMIDLEDATRLRREAKAGDLFIEARSDGRGPARVRPPVAVLHRADHARWGTRLYLDELGRVRSKRWREVKLQLRRLGLHRISLASARELRGRAAEIQHLLK